jgi:hypothetical protein
LGRLGGGEVITVSGCGSGGGVEITVAEAAGVEEIAGTALAGNGVTS